MIFALRNLGAFIAARTDVRNERGATMVEYGLLIAFIALVVGVAAIALGGGISNLFDDANTSVDSVDVAPLSPQ